MSSPDAKGVLPPPAKLEAARKALIHKLPVEGAGLDWVKAHLQSDIIPGLNQNGGQNYYGFVTGGATEAARYADNVVTAHDQNVQVHLPQETVATDVEAAALEMVCDLLAPDPQGSSAHPRAAEVWSHRTFTTGATASNVLGLACGREYVVQAAARRLGKSISTGDLGISSAMRVAELDTVQVLTTVAHSSLRKAASIVGLGWSNVHDVGRDDAPHVIDIDKLVSSMRQPKTASIVAVSCAEVNTGLFATNGDLMRQIRSACDEHGGWLHIDAAFGLLATVLPRSAGYDTIKAGVEELHLADSVAGDAHKLLNVPYDCGIFLSRYLEIATEVFQNPNAAYLSSAAQGSSGASEITVPSPLNIGIENSRRFRALPVYATLIAYGRQWYSDMLERQIQLSRSIARFIAETSGLELLPEPQGLSLEKRLESIYMIVIFRANKEELNANLTQRINATRRIYVGGAVGKVADKDNEALVRRRLLLAVFSSGLRLALFLLGRSSVCWRRCILVGWSFLLLILRSLALFRLASILRGCLCSFGSRQCYEVFLQLVLGFCSIRLFLLSLSRLVDLHLFLLFALEFAGALSVTLGALLLS